MSYRIPELLSPAGNMDCLNAAVSGGCDAVYAGCDRFGARAFAGNFTSDEFVEAIERMHIFGKRIYLTLNTLIKPEEFNEIYDFVKPFYEAGLDGVIVQDIGVISLLAGSFPDMEIHASTQMSVSSVYGVRLLQNMGVCRVVTSRELSLTEIADIQKETGAELECFIHGAMCYSYSGMCLMSSFLGGRSGNRGRCAGPCRQPYSIGKIKDKYLLSMKDLCTIDILDELIEAGISSFKIEGRMKSPAYVYGVTEIYRRNIDYVLDHPGAGYCPSEEDRRHLVELYSRGGISDGYYHRHNGLSLITVEKGSYKREDTGEPEPDRRRIHLNACFEAYAGQNIKLKAALAENEMQMSEGEVRSRDIRCPEIVVSGVAAEQASTRPMGEADFRKQLRKTGESDFIFDNIEIKTDGKSFVRVASINDIRRRALDEIRGRMLDGYKRSL